MPEGFRPEACAGGHDRPARRPSRLRRLLRPQRPLPAAVDTAHDGDSRAGCRRRAHRRRLAASCKGNAGRRFSAGRHRVLPRRRSACHRRTGLRDREPARASTRSSDPATPGSRRPRSSSPSTAPSTCWPAPPRSSSPAKPAIRRRIAADLVAQAEHDPDAVAIFITTRAMLAKSVIAEVTESALGATKLPQRRLQITAWRSSPAHLEEAHDTHQPHCSRAPDRRQRRRPRLGSQCRLGLHRPLVRAAPRRLHLRPESHAAHQRSGAGARRPQRARLPQAHHRPGILASRRPAARPGRHSPRERRRPRRPRGRDPTREVPVADVKLQARSPPPPFAA